MTKSSTETLYVVSQLAIGACVLALAVMIALGRELVPPRMWFVAVVLGAGAIWWSTRLHEAVQSESAKREAADRPYDPKKSGPKRLEDFE